MALKGLEWEVPCSGGGVPPIKASGKDGEVQAAGAKPALGRALGLPCSVGSEGVCAPSSKCSLYPAQGHSITSGEMTEQEGRGA